MKFKGLNTDEQYQLVPRPMCLLGYRGSIAHGTYVPQEDPDSIDDKDVMGVYIQDLRSYLGLNFRHPKPIEVVVKDWDAVHYDIRHFVSLLCKCNPNVLSLLWVDDTKLIHKDALGEELRQNRDIFTSNRIYHAFTGYAYGQLKRMESGNKHGFMGEKRKRLVDKHGYDTKNAAHLIRLLRMGIEFLKEGVLYVERSDADQLLQIKRGEWTLELVKSEAEYLFKRAEAVYDRSTLPNEPDIARAEQLVYNLIMTANESH